jgi:DNA-binding CsgD family transcriptional regulator
VQKHVEHIYKELGVETRKAVVLRAVEILKGA